MGGRTAISILFLLAWAGMGVSASAQPTQAQQDAIRSNCRSDFLSLCSGVPRGGREVFECLAKNEPRLSGGCRAAVSAVAPTAAPPAPAAKAEPAPTQATPAGPPPEPASATPAPAAPAASAPAPKAPAAKAAPKAAAPVRPVPTATAAPATAAPVAAPHQPKLGEAAIIRRFCFTDFRVLCKGVALGQGRAIRCLADNRPALSPPCRQAMADTGN